MHIKLYQVNMERDISRVAFLSYEKTFIAAGKVDGAVYDMVYDGEVQTDSDILSINLERVFRLFNSGEYTEDYLGRSMSVSDVVEVVDGKWAGFYFCDSVSFRKIEDFSCSTKIELPMIRVLVIEPGEKPKVKNIVNTLANLQFMLRGYIEATYPFADPVAISSLSDEYIEKYSKRFARPEHFYKSTSGQIYLIREEKE